MLLSRGQNMSHGTDMNYGEAYSDSRQAVTLGRFAAEPQDLEFEYSVPQENGTRIGMRELVLRYGSYGVSLHAHPHISLPEYSDYYPSFSLHEQDEFALTAARHPYELEANDGFWHLYLDGGQHGLGSRTCGQMSTRNTHGHHGR